MNEIVEKYAARALKLSEQYDTGEVTFADLSGLIEEFASQFVERLAELPDSQRGPTASALETEIESELDEQLENSKASEALNEILVALNRTPIY